MEALIDEIIPVAQQLWAEAKWLGALGAVLLFGIRIFRLDAVQSQIPDRFQWVEWPQWLKWVLPIVLAFAGSLAWKLGTDLSWGAAIAFALTSAAASIAGHKVTKTIGQIEGAKRGPDHKSGRLRRAASFVIPIARPPQ